MNILIIYGSLEGQTQKIANKITDILSKHNHNVTSLAGDDLPTNFSNENYDAVIIGGSIHMNKYPSCINDFVNSNSEWLNKLPSAFFTVCMAINSDRKKSRQQAISYGENFLTQTGWQPKLTATFAGAVKYTQYNFVIRFIMKMISKHEGGNTDTSHDHEYTNWESVKLFTEDFLRIIAK